MLFTGAALMLAYCGFVLMDASIFQRGESRRLERLVLENRAAASAAPEPAPHALPKQLPLAVEGSLVGRIQVVRLGLSAIVLEGTSRITLQRAVGHIARTALPGQPGNVGLAGHRDTFFRPLRDIQANDIITITTVLAEYRYRVVSTTIVNPHDVAMLDPDQNEILTLVTCYPFSFVGSAPSRFIVRARRI
jgi:sortase A